MYLWYSQTISVSKGCIGGTILCLLWAFLWYCCQSHCSLVVRMVVRCLPVFSYICDSSFCVCMVFCVVDMSFSGLHSVVTIWMCGSIKGGVMDLVSMGCMGVKCVSKMFV